MGNSQYLLALMTRNKKDVCFCYGLLTSTWPRDGHARLRFFMSPTTLAMSYVMKNIALYAPVWCYSETIVSRPPGIISWISTRLHLFFSHWDVRFTKSFISDIFLLYFSYSYAPKLSLKCIIHFYLVLWCSINLDIRDPCAIYGLQAISRKANRTDGDQIVCLNIRFVTCSFVARQFVGNQTNKFVIL